jgi:hypothetical protein
MTSSNKSTPSKLPTKVRFGQRNVSFRVEQGPGVEIVPDVVAFQHLDFSATVERVPSVIAGRLVLDEPPSRYLLDRLCLDRPASGETLTATGLRAVPVDFVVTQVCLFYGVDGPRLKDGYPKVLMPDPDQVRHGVELRQRGLEDPDALRFVARIYLDTSLRADSPIDWVATYFDCSRPTASRWVAAAKDAGFLRVASQRRRD